MTRIKFAWALCLSLAVLATSALAGGNVPSLGDPELGQGPFAKMHMLLEKTLLKVDVANIDVRFGKATEAKLKAATGGKPGSGGKESQLAKIAVGADRAVIQLKFLRSVPLNMWINGVRESLEKAEKAGMVSGALRKKVSDGLPHWFSPLKDRGFKEGDRILYSIKKDSLRTVAVTVEGNVVVDRSDAGADKANLVLATYFAPGTDYREPLLESLGR